MPPPPSLSHHSLLTGVWYFLASPSCSLSTFRDWVSSASRALDAVRSSESTLADSRLCLKHKMVA